MQTIFVKCPFKENGKLLKLFGLILRGLYLPVGSDIPQTMTEMYIFYSRCFFCGVLYPAEQRPAGSDTPPNEILLDIRPCGTKFCGVSHPGEQL
jgi:hypothetical protein